jgi:hypothetical protein
MKREDFVPGVYFKIKDSVYQYETIESEFGGDPIGSARLCSGLGGRESLNMTVRATGIELFTYFGAVEISSNIIRFSQISIVEPTLQPQTI